MKMRITKPSPALVVACFAVILALGPAVQAANSIFSTDIVDGQVKTVDIDTGAIVMSKLAKNSVWGGDVLDNTLSLADIVGADVSGNVSINTGFVAAGLCKDLDLAIAGAGVGEAVVISARAALPGGILLSGVRVSSAGHVTLKVCNFTGTTMQAITDLPIRVVTFG